MGIRYTKPDYSSEHFKNWQQRNPGAPSEWYQPSVEIHGRSNPDYVMGTNPEWDANERFLRSNEKPTMGEALAYQNTQSSNFTPPSGHIPDAPGHTPNYSDLPGSMVTQNAIDTGFELFPNMHYDVVDKLPDYASNNSGPIESYGRRIGEPSPNILNQIYTPGQVQPTIPMPSNAGNLINQNPMTNDWNWQQYLTQFPQQQQQQNQTGTQNQNNSNPYWNSPMMSLY